jgi:lipopolysaccharide transport system permease protein
MVAKISTDGLPPVMFYLSGIVAWRYFSDCLQKTSNTFVSNANIFGKVYFPRLTIPLSVVISNLIALSIQLLLFAVFWLYFHLQGTAIRVESAALLLPLLILQMAVLSLGCGMIVSSLTTKYRDLTQLVGFGLQLWMYATPVVYPSSLVPEKFQWLMAFNPMAPIIESFRYALLGVGTVYFGSIAMSVAMTLVILLAGVLLFSRIEKNFIDTV